jgi:serine/threonine protein kinase
MPAPTTTEEFLDLIRKSGVLDEKRLMGHLERLRGQGLLSPDPNRLATQMVRDGVLTHFQAEQFLQGKWKRFTIGKYKVLERLGAGGMGSVYLCEHTLMRRRVAVKVLPANKANDSSSLERFYREARAVAALDHPNIVRAYDIDQDENLHFLVMEHVDGASLQEIIKRSGPMDPIRCAHYMRQAALGLQHAHETASLVHRDIKPGNVLVDRNGIVKILDMGLARFFHDNEDDLTKKFDESVLGTADYLAPEQALDSHSVDIRADIYSLGGTLYWCLTGRTPFNEGSVAQKLLWHQTRQPKAVASFRSDVPEGILAVLEKMMHKKPEERYQLPQEVADAFAEWTTTPIPPPPENEMPQLSLAATRGPLSEAGLSNASSTLNQSKTSASGSLVPTPPTSLPSPSTRTGAPPRTTSSASQVPQPLPRPPVARSVPMLELPSSHGEQLAPIPVAPVPRPQLQPIPVPTSAPVPAPVPIPPVPPRPLSVEPELSVEDEPSLEEPRPRQRLSALRKKTPEPPKLNLLWLWIGAAVMLALVSLLIWALIPSTPPKKTTPPREAIKVPAGSPNGLSKAVRDAKDGDRIILQGDISEANIQIKKKDLIIEAEGGKKVTWKCPPNASIGSKLLIVEGVPGFELRGITLDGDNQLDSVIILYGKCPGLKLDNVSIVGGKINGLLLMNCEGSATAPILISDLSVDAKANQTAIRFDIAKHSIKTVDQIRNVTFEKLTFPGPGRKLVQGATNMTDPESVKLPSGFTIETVP